MGSNTAYLIIVCDPKTGQLSAEIWSKAPWDWGGYGEFGCRCYVAWIYEGDQGFQYAKDNLLKQIQLPNHPCGWVLEHLDQT